MSSTIEYKLDLIAPAYVRGLQAYAKARQADADAGRKVHNRAKTLAIKAYRVELGNP